MATASKVPARSKQGPSRRRRRPLRRTPRPPAWGRRPYWSGRRPRRSEGHQPPSRGDSVRKVIRGVGKTLISIGVLLFLFVGYQLWGTNLAEARDQRALEKQFSQFSAPAPPATGARAAPPATAAPPVLGDAAALIEIPKISVQKYVVEGVSTEDLKKGPGHYPDTPMPGRPGNAAIAGHRTTYGAPFGELDKLAPGDPIFVTTPEGRFRYDVDRTDIVDPSQSEVLDNTPDNRLTLTTCHPRFSAAERMIVVAKLISPVLEPPPPPAAEPAPEETPPAPKAGLDAGLSGAGTSNGPTIAWGLLAAVVWALTWWVSRWWRRWPTYIVGAGLFLVALYVFFENVSRLLPANV